MPNAIYSPVVPRNTHEEICDKCGNPWPNRFGDHNCNSSHLYVHNCALVIEPGAEMLESIKRLAGRLVSETCRAAQSLDLGGEEPPYRSVLGDVDSSIGYLKRYRQHLQYLAEHKHDWDTEDFCSICGTDGRA